MAATNQKGLIESIGWKGNISKPENQSYGTSKKSKFVDKELENLNKATTEVLKGQIFSLRDERDQLQRDLAEERRSTNAKMGLTLNKFEEANLESKSEGIILMKDYEERIGDLFAENKLLSDELEKSRGGDWLGRKAKELMEERAKEQIIQMEGFQQDLEHQR